MGVEVRKNHKITHIEHLPAEALAKVGRTSKIEHFFYVRCGMFDFRLLI